MKNKLIAKRYAEAFFDNVKVEDFDVLLKDLTFLKNLFVDNEESASIINLFIFPAKDRQEIFLKIGENLKFNGIWQKLFNLLVEKHKFSIILPLLEDIESNILAKQNKVKVDLRVANDLDDEIREKLRLFLEKKYDKKIILNFIEDKDIIGGFVAETEDEMIDGSVKNHLEQFKRFVMNHD